MLRMQPFDLIQPRDIDEAIASFGVDPTRSRYISGGTDLLPNMKLAYGKPERLISLRHIADLRTVSVQSDVIRLGAGMRLTEVADHPDVQEHMPALAQAISRIATPQIRNMATLGGNICLDTRCRYINQSELFRDALGGCLKSHGTVCHVVPGGRNCVAAFSSDSGPVLIVAEAILEIVGPEGLRRVPVREFYSTDGLAHAQLEPGDILVAVEIPRLDASTHIAYRKWAVRKCFDFPLVSVALRLELEPGDSKVLKGGRACVGVLGPKPKVIELKALVGRALDLEFAEELGQLIFKKSKPLPNVPYDTAYRRRRLGVEAKRMVLELLDGI